MNYDQGRKEITKTNWRLKKNGDHKTNRKGQ